MSIREASHSGSWYPSSGMKNFRKSLSIWDYIKRETVTMNLKAFVVLFFCPWKSSQGAEREVRRMVIQSQSLVTTSQGDYSTVSICNVSEIRLPIEVLLNRWAIVKKLKLFLVIFSWKARRLSVLWFVWSPCLQTSWPE